MQSRTLNILRIVILATIATAASAQSTSWQIGPFTRPLDAPIIHPNPASVFPDPITHTTAHWEALHTFNPAAVLAPDGSPAVLYRAEDDSGEMMVGGHTSRLGLSRSPDGLHFTTQPAPVLYPGNDAQSLNEVPGGVEDPRLVQTRDGTYVLTYTQWARLRQTYTVGIATSSDLVHWTKHGPAFAHAEHRRYAHLMYKSAGILTEIDHGRLIAARLQGKYWMYWGEGTIRLATSSNLLDWNPVLDPATHEPLALLAPRAGHFDSGFPETGPPPILTPAGIVLLYNAKNAPAGAEFPGDPALAPGTYSVGEALFSAANPATLLARTDKPVFQPQTDYERSGQYRDGTTFAEGLILFKDQWLLYYGCADSFVAVATAPFSRTTPAASR